MTVDSTLIVQWLRADAAVLTSLDLLNNAKEARQIAEGMYADACEKLITASGANPLLATVNATDSAIQIAEGERTLTLHLDGRVSVREQAA